MPPRKYPPKPSPKPSNQDWLAIIAQSILDEEPVRSIVLQLRDEFDLLDPYDAADRDENLAKPRGPIRQRAAELLRQAVWPPNEYHVALLGYFFAPERARDDILKALLGEEALTAEQARLARALAEIVYLMFAKTDLAPLFVELVVDLTSTYAVEGYLKLPRELPSWFAGNVLEFPFVMGDRMLVAFVTRFADLRLVQADLEREFKAKLKKRKRLRPRKHPECDMWINTEYHHIKEELPDRQAQIVQMADLLDIEEGDAAEIIIYDELLRRFENSPWSDQLARYDLATKEGRNLAKGFLRVIVHRTQQDFREIINALPPENPEHT